MAGMRNIAGRLKYCVAIYIFRNSSAADVAEVDRPFYAIPTMSRALIPLDVSL